MKPGIRKAEGECTAPPACQTATAEPMLGHALWRHKGQGWERRDRRVGQRELEGSHTSRRALSANLTLMHLHSHSGAVWSPEDGQPRAQAHHLMPKQEEENTDGSGDSHAASTVLSPEPGRAARGDQTCPAKSQLQVMQIPASLRALIPAQGLTSSNDGGNGERRGGPAAYTQTHTPPQAMEGV